jgi:geranyl-CoA carboxylase alpha subunit
MEMNTRLQVEHPVTEMVSRLDLVEWQLRVAQGEPLPLGQDAVRFDGHAIEARLCAEDPARDFLPQAGRLALWRPAAGVRTEHALASGLAIPPYYDSMIAKLIACAPTRDAARERLACALDDTVVLGLPTNKAFLAAVLRDARFAAGRADTDFLSGFSFQAEEPGQEDYRTALALLAADYGEWSGWSNNPAHRARAAFDGRTLEIDLRGARPDPGLPQAIDGDTVHFARGGASFTLRNALYDPPRRKGAAAGDGRLVAPMNGRVVAVPAQAGERIEAGQPLVVLEAMKMEHSLCLDFSARIASLHVAPGAQVAPGQLLAEFEAA